MSKEKIFRNLAVSGPQDLIFGFAPKPVKCGFDLTIGAGTVFPEVNFTLPVMDVSTKTWPEVIAHYEEMATNILKRAVAMKVPGIVLEFEQLPQMTETPEWGAEITALLERHLKQNYEKYGLRGAARITPADIRGPAGVKGVKPVMRHGELWEKLNRSFDLCIAAGGDLISIESIGAKEVHDEGLMFGDVRAIVFALGVLACRDMTWLWSQIVDKCEKSGHSVPAGDTACGFANTSMVLAYQKLLPDVVAAVDRAMAGVRTLKAVECGAKGPSKDCGYENPIVKAISGIPISQEGKSATCAHFSHVGNMSSTMCDLWSNESVQNIRLLSGNAPEAYTELLAYDVRLMNIANEKKQGKIFQSWMIESDQNVSAIGTILAPESVYTIAKAIVAEETDYLRTVAAGKAALDIIQKSVDKKNLNLGKKELQWLERLHKEFANLPKDENVLAEEIFGTMGHLFDPECYGLKVAAAAAK
ncbi:MAG TPA: methyltransferase MtaB domain-containing protein [Terriglobales bacterium]|nr:methyltransferase MtaB domain-containing protein [Terriglobales bacterium]